MGRNRAHNSSPAPAHRGDRANATQARPCWPPKAVPALARLVENADRADVLTICVNDNHDDWTAERTQVSQGALGGTDRSVVEPILPREDVPFLIQARHSAFYETELEYLLRREGIERGVLCGQVTEQCILYSALDASVRRFEIVVSRDVVAHIHEDLADAALRKMQGNMRAEVLSNSDRLLLSARYMWPAPRRTVGHAVRHRLAATGADRSARGVVDVHRRLKG
jgi:nicotinamidase-related amidase